ncbi:hypothetical protein BDF22DRAFT_745776 [Syncephalis plumigaleata]|nr:hypothetical protein BDF22DRAFT_745776 [Syncephalis plumigaleata]
MDPYRPPPSYGYGHGPPQPRYGLGSYGRGNGGMAMGRGMGPPPGQPPMGRGYGPPPPHFGRHEGFPGRGGGFPGRGVPPPTVTSLYVGGISPGISDMWMEQLLRACGNVFRWTRGHDAEKKPKSYGFCEYATPVDALRALRILGGEKQEGGHPIELPIPGKTGERKKLIIRADEKVRAKLDKHEAETEKDQATIDDTTAMDGVQTILKNMFDAAANNTLDDNAKNANNEEEEVAPDLDPEQRQIVSREIAFFRERAAKRDRELEEREKEAKRRQEESERAARERFEPQPLKQGALTTRDSRSSESSRSGRLYYGVIYTYGWVLNSSRLIEEEDIETRIKAEKERDYQERLQSFTHRENRRIDQAKREEKLLNERRERREHDRVKEERRLREWNDDKEEDAAIEEYYEDRSRWRKRRQEIRQRERELDERDQQREERIKREAEEAAEREKQREREREREVADKLSDAKGKRRSRGGGGGTSKDFTAELGQSSMHPDRMRMLGIEDGTHAATSVITMNNPFANTVSSTNDGASVSLASDSPRSASTSTSTPVPTPLMPSGMPVKLNLTTSTTQKRTMIGALALGEGNAGDGDEHADEGDTRKRRRLAPPPPIPPVEDPEERKRLIEKLIKRIPVEPEGLWQWSVQWDYLTETVLYEKIQGFVAKKVEEVLGVPEDELVSFVIDHIHQRGKPTALVDELEMALDEEAVRLVARLWRMLIYETEARAQGIA